LSLADLSLVDPILQTLVTLTTLADPDPSLMFLGKVRSITLSGAQVLHSGSFDLTYKHKTAGKARQ